MNLNPGPNFGTKFKGQWYEDELHAQKFTSSMQRNCSKVNLLAEYREVSDSKNWLQHIVIVSSKEYYQTRLS